MIRIPAVLIAFILIESCRSAFPLVEDYRDAEVERSITVAHISDLHFGRFRSIHRRTAEAIESLNPDILVITGDAVNGPSGLEALGRFLAMLPVATQTYAIPGNWEYGEMLSLNDLENLYQQHQVQFLINESSDYRKGDTMLRISGLDDYLFGEPDYALVDPELEYPEIVLIHEPAAFRYIPSSSNKKTVLAGHTHGGQVTFFGKAFYLPPGSAGYVKGQYDAQGKVLYVSRGIGSGVITLRIFARPDILVYSFW